MAARSFAITVENSVKRLWKRTALGLSHGEWSNGGASVPPDQIAASTVDADGDTVSTIVQFGSESDGFATGTEGFVQYESAPTATQPLATLRIEWNNPFFGSNSWSAKTAPEPPYKADPYYEKGNQAKLKVKITKV